MWKLTQYMNISSSLKKNKYGCSELYRDQIFSQAINLYKKKFDWLFIVDPIWLVWNTYISHSLTDSSIDPKQTRRADEEVFFLQKNNSKTQLDRRIARLNSLLGNGGILKQGSNNEIH